MNTSQWTSDMRTSYCRLKGDHTPCMKEINWHCRGCGVDTGHVYCCYCIICGACRHASGDFIYGNCEWWHTDGHKDEDLCYECEGLDRFL